MTEGIQISAYVYVLKGFWKTNGNETYYIGETTNLRQRMSQHYNEIGGKSTKKIKDKRLVLAILIKNPNFRKSVEMQLKSQPYLIEHFLGIKDHKKGHETWEKWLNERGIEVEVKFCNNEGKYLEDMMI